jgi:ribosome modulation factor
MAAPSKADQDKAYQRGWASFINGRARDENPFDEAVLRDCWRDGYEASAAAPHAVLVWYLALIFAPIEPLIARLSPNYPKPQSKERRMAIDVRSCGQRKIEALAVLISVFVLGIGGLFVMAHFVIKYW